MDDKRISSNISSNSYNFDYKPNSSYLIGETIQTSVPYAANHANNFSAKVEELDLSVNVELEKIENVSSEWLSSSLEFLEQLRTLNNEEIERLQTENNNLESMYQEFTATIPQNPEIRSKIKELEIKLNQLKQTYGNNTSIPGIEAQMRSLEVEISNLYEEEKIQYIMGHSDEFKSFMGMGYEEYNQKIAENKFSIITLNAKDYELRQLAKEMPYLDIMMTDGYLNYISSNDGVSAQSMTYLENRNLESYLTEEQLMMFSYLYDTMGWQEAYKYLGAIEDKINQAKGRAEANLFLASITDEEGNVDVGAWEYTLRTTGQGLWNGIENFGEGFENLFDVNSDGMITDNQYAQQFILQGLSELQKNGQLSQYIDDTYQISTSIGNMLPGTVISILTCGTFGQVLMGMSAAGNAKNEALTSISDNKALAYTYGLLNGLSEAVLGEVMGNIPGLNEAAKFSLKGILSEGAEEFIQTYVDAGFKFRIYGIEPDFDELSEEGLRSFLYGCITSGIMTGTPAAINFTINGVKYSYNNISELINAYSAGELTSSHNKNNSETVDTNISSNSNLINDPTDDGAIARANYHTAKGITQTFRFSDAEHMPNRNSSFWTSFNNPELIQVNVDGKLMTLDDAVSYKMQYDLNVSGVEIDVENKQVINTNTNINDTKVFSDLISKLGINDARKAIWHVTYGQDYSYVPVELRNMLEGFSIEQLESFLENPQNYTTVNSDNNGQIRINSLSDISLDYLATLPKSTIFVLEDGRLLTYDSVKKILANSDTIKSNLLSTVSNIQAPVPKARKLYYELNKLLHYDMNYVKGDTGVKHEILNNEVSFANLNPYNTVVCKGWSELYRELLISAGFNEKQVKIVGSGHWWVEIDLGNGNIISADATDVINGSIDLANCKAGMSTNGFIILEGKNSGLRLSNIYKYEENMQFIEEQQNDLIELDRSLGYAGDNGYLLDEINKASNLFANSKVYNSLFAQIDLRKKVNSIFDMNIPTNMDGYEVFAYNRILAKKILGDDYRSINQQTLYRENNGTIEPVNYMRWTDQKTGELMIQVYSLELGKIRFTTLTDFDNFMKSYNWRN